MKRGRKLVAWSIATTVTLLLTALVGSSFYMLDFALSPLQRSDDEAIERLAHHAPDAVVSWVDSVRSVGALRDTTIDIDGVPAHAWYLRADADSMPVALLVHGYKDTGLSMLHIAHLYHHDLGMNVLMPDLPAHGHTPGDHIDMGWSDDCKHVLRWIEVADDMFRGGYARCDMVLHGISMGASTVMNVAGSMPSACVRCVVEDCGYTSAWDEFSYQLDAMFGLPKFPLLYTTSALCRLRYGWSFGQASSLKQLTQCHLPMLFNHGDSDDFVPTAMVQTLYDAKPQPKQLWLAPGSAHARAYSDHPVEYTRLVGDFVGQYCQ